MECLSGSVVKGNETIAENLEIWLAHGPEGEGDWNGTFELPPGTHVDVGGQYQMALEDGRSGPFTVTNVGGEDKEPHAVGFRGTGPLSSS